MSGTPGSSKCVDESLSIWLRAEFGLAGPVSVRQVTGGLSNVTSIATDSAGRRVVIRRPPEGIHHGGAHDVLREARILQALDAFPLPTPRVLASVDADQAGMPFYVMEFVDGVVLTTTEDAASMPVRARRSLGLELMEVLSLLKEVDLDAAGLADMRRSAPYVQRQLRRWSTQWANTATREVPAVERAHALLETRATGLKPVPECLVHGDFRLGNVMVADATGDPRITALMDWELTTVGHPLADLGYLGARMTAPAEVLLGGADPLCCDGFPSFQELSAAFAHGAGVDLAELPFFVALNVWRWAVLVEGIQNRLSGAGLGEVPQDVSADPAWHRRRVEVLAQFAVDLLS